MEELLLGARLALEELDVVEQEDVDVAETGLECLGAPRRERGEEGVRELLPGRADAPSGQGSCASRRFAIELRRWVLPTPGGPQMNSGL